MIDHRPCGRGPYAVKLAEIKPTDVILDVGCFTGYIERYFLRGRCASYFGIDANSEAIHFAQGFPDGENFQLGKSEVLPFPDETFDKVLFLDTLEHVEDEHRSIAEIRRVLKPNGTLVLSVPHDFLNFLDPDELTRGIRNFIRKYIRKRPLLDHPIHRHYSEGQLRGLLSGFDITYVHKNGTPVFWFLLMFYHGIALPDWLTKPFRLLTDPIENFEYSFRLPTGFNIMLKATKTAQSQS
jgi:SAM-dependent methyltransferase